MSCAALKNISIPDSVTNVGERAFLNCTGLRNVLYNDSEAQWNAIEIGQNNEPLLGADIRFNVVDWGFCGADGDGANVIWVFDSTKTLTFAGEGAMKNHSPVIITDENTGDTLAEYPALPWTVYLTGPKASVTVVMEEGVTRLGEYALPLPNCVLELRVMNRECDLAALDIKEPVFLRGFMDSTAEDYANDHDDDCLFMPLCSVDYHHTVVWDPGEEPTCTRPGYREGVYCTDCDEYIYGHWETGLVPHTWSDWTVTKPATAEEEGEEERTCAVCDKKETRVIEKGSTGGAASDDDDDDNTNPIKKALKSLIAWFQKLLAFFKNI